MLQGSGAPEIYRVDNAPLQGYVSSEQLLRKDWCLQVMQRATGFQLL